MSGVVSMVEFGLTCPDPSAQMPSCPDALCQIPSPITLMPADASLLPLLRLQSFDGSNLHASWIIALDDNITTRRRGHYGSQDTTSTARKDWDMLTGVVTGPEGQFQQEHWGRANTKALMDLMADFYPLLQRLEKSQLAPTDAEYWEKHKKLRNRLSCARN